MLYNFSRQAAFGATECGGIQEVRQGCSGAFRLRAVRLRNRTGSQASARPARAANTGSDKTHQALVEGAQGKCLLPTNLCICLPRRL